MAENAAARPRLGAGLVLTLSCAAAVALAVAAVLAALTPETAKTPAPAAATIGTRPVTTEAALQTVDSSTGRFSVSIPSTFEIRIDKADDSGSVYFAADAGGGMGDFTDEGVAVVLVPVKPGSTTLPSDTAGLRALQDSLTTNADRCAQASTGTDAITPPADTADRQDWEWTGCPNGWVERDLAFFEPSGRYGVVVSARAADSAAAEAIVEQSLTSLEVKR